MDTIIFEFNDLKIIKRGNRFFAHYDAGAHQVVMREDEISKEDAEYACRGSEMAQAMLFRLQKRLIDAGIDPYVSGK